jgi:preprotein translocase subunit Sss1
VSKQTVEDYVNYIKKRKRVLKNLIDIYQEGFFAYTKSELEEKLNQCNRILKRWGCKILEKEVFENEICDLYEKN